MYVIAMAILLAPVPFFEKANIPFATFTSGREGLSRDTHGSHIVLTLPISMLGVDDPCLR